MGGVETQMKGLSYVEEHLNFLLLKNTWLVSYLSCLFFVINIVVFVCGVMELFMTIQ